MKHTTPPKTVRTAGSIFVALGAVTMAGQAALQAQLSGQGSAVGTLQPTEMTWVAQETVMAAAPVPSSASGVLAFGMLMMLIGFGLHAWYILRKGNGRPVPVRIRKHKAKKPQAKKSPRNSRRQAEVIWIERTIRF